MGLTLKVSIILFTSKFGAFHIQKIISLIWLQKCSLKIQNWLVQFGHPVFLFVTLFQQIFQTLIQILLHFKFSQLMATSKAQISTIKICNLKSSLSKMDVKFESDHQKGGKILSRNAAIWRVFEMGKN
jgi:hypothetical protein